MSELASKITYQVPRLKLCLIHEGLTANSLYHIKNPFDVERFFEPLRHVAEEYFVSLHLNSRHEVIGMHEVSHGTLSGSLVHPREVFKIAFLANTYAVIFGHNHPSGSVLEPSKEDITITRQLIEAGKLLGISVLDHLIISPNQNAFSLKKEHPELWKN